MTDRERIENIKITTIKECNMLREVSCNGCKHTGAGFRDCMCELFIDKLLENEVTFKKKREYIRKSPCKCGARGKQIRLWHIGKPEKWYYFCLICGRESKTEWKKYDALIEWNKISGVTIHG